MAYHKNVKSMTKQEIERELKDFEWEYVALSDRSRTDQDYNEGRVVLDERKKVLTEELSVLSAPTTVGAEKGAKREKMAG
jgi:hypothetical protein